MVTFSYYPFSIPAQFCLKKKKQAHIEAFSYAGAVCQQGNTELSFLVLLLKRIYKLGYRYRGVTTPIAGFWLFLYVLAHPCEIPALRSSVVTLIELPIKPQHLQSDSMALAAKLHPKMVLIHFFAIVNQVCNSQLHLFLQGRADLYGFEVFIHSHRCMSFLSVLEGEVPRDDIRLWHPPFRIGLSGDLCLASNFLAAHTVEII